MNHLIKCQSRVTNAFGDHALGDDRSEVITTVCGQQASRRFVTDQSARGLPGCVSSHRRRNSEDRNYPPLRCRRTSGGATRRALEVPGAAGDAFQQAVGDVHTASGDGRPSNQIEPCPA